MAPVEGLTKLIRRDWMCPPGYTYSNGNCYRSSWYNWGRWVVLAIAVGLFLIVLLSCLSVARRRRRRGVRPMYGTGWMAPQSGKWGNTNQHQMNDYNQNYSNYQAYPPQNNGFQPQEAYGGYPAPPPPPAYGQHQQPQYTGTTFNTSDGYYATGAAGVQPPQGVYQRDEVYGPPQGPPPGKQ